MNRNTKKPHVAARIPGAQLNDYTIMDAALLAQAKDMKPEERLRLAEIYYRWADQLSLSVGFVNQERFVKGN